MSLRSKIALALFAAVSLFAAGDQVLNRWAYADGHQELDQARARERMERVVSAFESQLVELDVLCRFFAAHLEDPESLNSTELADLVIAYDSEGWVKLHRLSDPGTGEPLQLREFPNERMPMHHPLVHEWAVRSKARGWFVTERGALLVSTVELPKTDGSQRYVATGRFLDPEMLAQIRLTSGDELQVSLIQGRLLSDEEEHALSLVEAATGTATEPLNGEKLRSWHVLHDLRSTPALLLSDVTPREVNALWFQIWQSSLLSTLALVIAFPFILLLLLQWIVTGPLNRLSSQVIEIGHSNDTDQRLHMSRGDEIGHLADEFDGMLDLLAQSRLEVVRSARLAGMSEVSAGVIHNVQNVLNSVNVSAQMMQRHLKELTCNDLRVVLLEVEAHADDLNSFLTSDKRGRNLIPFFSAVVNDCEEKASRARFELHSLGEGVERIASLISSMDSFEACMGVAEEFGLAAQLDAACELSIASLELNGQVKVKREYASIPRLLLDRHKLMQIFVNLLLNALQATEGRAADERRILLRVAKEDDQTARIEITDNGVGIEEEDLRRVFASGFSTRPGSKGLGLHLAATTATELGARIEVHSPGLGQGATFVVHLPLKFAHFGVETDAEVGVFVE